MLKIALCDDEKIHLEEMRGLIEDYLRQHEQDFSLSLFSNNAEFLATFEAGIYDIVILDIIMPQKTGLEISKIIFETDKKCSIAFLTSSPDYAIMGYGVNAVTYMLKPPTREKVAVLLEACIDRVRKIDNAHHLFVKIGPFNQKIDLDRTIYLESKNKQVLVHCDDETVVFNGKLSDILQRLPKSFTQVHKSYVVNLYRIKAMRRNSMIADTDQAIPISRQFQKDASTKYFAHLEDITE